MEAAIATKDALAREALVRIRIMFQLEAGWTSLPPSERRRRRQLALRPLLDDFFAWAEPHRTRLAATRGLLASAFGYAVRQELRPARRLITPVEARALRESSGSRTGRARRR